VKLRLAVSSWSGRSPLCKGREGVRFSLVVVFSGGGEDVVGGDGELETASGEPVFGGVWCLWRGPPSGGEGEDIGDDLDGVSEFPRLDEISSRAMSIYRLPCILMI